MNNTVCVIDLDGTLYPKDSDITIDLRNRVIHRIAQKKNLSFENARIVYFGLARSYPNPFEGFNSVGITPDEYRSIFLNEKSWNKIKPNVEVKYLLALLSKFADICVVSFAPNGHVINMLKALGVYSYVSAIYTVNKETFYRKDYYYKIISEMEQYTHRIAVGDDYYNDIAPANKYAFKTYHVDNSKNEKNISVVLTEIISSFKQVVPKTIRIENISHCNENCSICPYPNLKRKKGVMSRSTFEKALIEHSSLVDNPNIIFPASIGEPMLDEMFFERISFANKYYDRISVFTNGTMLNQDALMKYIDCGGTELMLTLHGYYKDINENITGKKFYDVVKNNIVNAAKVNDSKGRPLTIYLDIYADLSEECEMFVSYMVGFGVKANRIDLKNTHNWGGRVQGYSNRIPQRYCERLYKQFGVLFDGRVVPCCVDAEGECILGNINDNSLSKILYSPKYLLLRGMEGDGVIKMNPLCENCNII